MVDPISAAAVAAATVFATKLAEGVGGAAGEALAGVAGRIVDRIRRLAADDPETGAAVTLLEKKPSDEGRIAQLGELLAARAAADPDLATELVALIGEARQAGVVNIGGAHIGKISGGQVTQVRGNQYNAGRDQYNAGRDQYVRGRDPQAGGGGRPDPAPQPKPERPIRILFLAANPLDTEPLRLDEEMRAIDEALRKADYRDRFEIRQQWAVRIGDLQEALLRHRPDIVHFSGHGTDTSEIVLEDQAGASQVVPQHALAGLFSVLPGDIRCVVLNACYSKTQAQAIGETIDCVVGMTSAVGDDAAIDFATAFYRALGFGQSVQTAFDLGTNMIDLQGLPDVDIPHLVARKVKAADVSFVLSQATSQGADGR